MVKWLRRRFSLLGQFGIPGLLTFLFCLSSAGTQPILIDGLPAHPDRLLAQLKDPDPSGSIRSLAAPSGENVVRRFETIPGLLVLEPDGTESKSTRSKAAPPKDPSVRLKERKKALLNTGLYEFVEPDWVVTIDATPNDSAFTGGTLWGLRNTGQSGGTAGVDIDAVAAWDLTTGSSGVVVAVIDTGIRHTHQDLRANLWRNPGEIPGNGIDDDGNGYVDDVHGINAITGSGDPMDDQGHGTHVAGSIGAQGNGGGSHVGVAWNVSIMGLKFLSADGSGFNSDAIRCIDYATSKGALISNNSWGGGGYSSALRSAIQRANQAGMLFVAAAGNEASDNDRTPSYPASYDVPNIVSVASIDRTGALSSFSNYGATSVHLAAPGSSIFSTVSSSDSAYATYSGTSMASPHVAGAAALVAARFPNARAPDLKQRLLQSTVPLPSLAGQTISGGRLSAAGALSSAPDGTLQVSVATAPSPLLGGRQNDFFLTVSDFNPITNATVTGRIGSGSTVQFADNGATPDQQAGDGIYSARLSVPSGTNQIPLAVSASRSGYPSVSTTFPLPVIAVPANDNFAAAFIATGTRSTGSNANASSEPGEPRSPSVAGGASVWWTWRAPASGSVTITTSGSDFDTTLAIYTGTSLGTLSLVASNDDAIGLQSSVTFNSSANTIYRVQVDGYNGATGSVVLNHPEPAGGGGGPRIIEEPVGLTVLEGRSAELSVLAEGAGLSYQWYRDGTPVPNAIAATLSFSAISEAEEGSYFVRVTNSQGSIDSRTVFLSVNQVGIVPDNDRFANALNLQGTQGRLTGDTGAATGEPGEPNHGGLSAPLHSLWFSWSANAGGELSIDTFGSGFNTILAVYTGSSLGNLREVAFNDDTIGLQSQIILRTNTGERYWIAIDGYDEERGSFILNHSFEPDPGTVPTADFFRDRLPLSGSSVLGSNRNATGEPGEPNHAGTSSPLASAWWFWTAPATGTVTIDTVGSDFDTTLAVYQGNRVDRLNLIASNDDDSGLQSSVRFRTPAGAIYQIAVDGFSTSTGSIQLNVEMIGDDGHLYEFDANFGSLRRLGGTRFLSSNYGTITFVGNDFDRGWTWSESLRSWLRGSARQVDSAEYGRLQPGGSDQWVFSEFFGWLYFGVDSVELGGWVWSERLGWTRAEHTGQGVYLYSDRLLGWISVLTDGSFHSFDYRRLIPVGGDRFRSPIFGDLTLGDFSGWLFSDRFGWLWAARDETATWFWSDNRNEWLGVTPEGGLWSTAERRFL